MKINPKNDVLWLNICDDGIPRPNTSTNDIEVIGERNHLRLKGLFHIIVVVQPCFNFFNRALFLLYGYDLSLLNNTSVESIEDYYNASKVKLPILTALMLLSAVSLRWGLS